jgi:hypothetical protein
VKSHFEAQLGTFQEEEGSELLYAYPLLDKNDNQENDEMTPTQNLLTNCSSEYTSIQFHDYCGAINPASFLSISNKNEQTTDTSSFLSYNSVTVQTSSCSTRSILIQTDHVEEAKLKTADIGIQCRLPDITIEDIEKDDEKMMLYTGLPNAGTFYALFDEMDDAELQTSRSASRKSKGRPRTLRLVDEFFLVLMRLRLGLIVEDLGCRFGISKSTCSTIINLWIDYLSIKLKFLIAWPSRELIDRTMPKKFLSAYPKTRVIIDCTELYTETPQSLTNKSLMFSHYKSHMTYKALIGISPSGLITFASDLWAGSISDKQMVRSCGILDLCERGDAIMADKGFVISDLTTPKGIHLIIPPFKHRRFSRREVEETRRIANLRIYVEMAIERVKNYRILQGNINISMAPRLSKIFELCCGFTNLQPPLILHD